MLGYPGEGPETPGRPPPAEATDEEADLEEETQALAQLYEVPNANFPSPSPHPNPEQGLTFEGLCLVFAIGVVLIFACRRRRATSPTRRRRAK